MDSEDGRHNDSIRIETPTALLDTFIKAGDLCETIAIFKKLCESLDINQKNYKTLYTSIKNGLTSWKARSLWAKLDKRAEHKDYKNKPCARNKVLIVGAGPCGLRTAIEAALLGAQVVVLEKRDRFSRNNVLHLWPFLITDLKNLGAKKFFGQFCAGSLDHLSIKRLQLILLKVSLLFGVQIHPKCSFLKLVEPKEGHGWKAAVEPSTHPASKFEFDMVVGADGRREALKFKGKEFRGKLAIGITVNFFNRNSKEEASVEEISGVAFIFNQGFFQDLKDTTGIDLENIVYYKDETHYFVMCAKKQSLLSKGVIKKDLPDAYDLLNPKNVNHDKLLAYAREAADFSTKHQLPHLDFALNHQNREDVAMFDFTSLYAAKYSVKIYERKGYRLLATIVGDSLLEPFWPTGSGCARGFLGCFDAAWTMRGFGLQKQPLDLIAERESSFRLLAQTTPENLNKNFDSYGINPDSRYPNFRKSTVQPNAIRHLYDGQEGPLDSTDGPEPMDTSKPVEPVEPAVNVEIMLKWCQQHTKSYRHVDINDMSSSWRDGLAFCAIIHRFRPDLINFDTLKPGDIEKNNHLAFETAEEQLGIPPQISANEMTTAGVPDRLMIVSYVSQYYETFKNETPVVVKDSKEDKPQRSYKTKSPLSKLSIITRISRRKEKRKSGAAQAVTAKKSKHSKENEAPTSSQVPAVKEVAVPIPVNVEPSPNANGDQSGKTVTTTKASNRISALAEQVFGAKENTKPVPGLPSGRDTSEHCFFCNRWVYLMERLSAEGHFFHRECFKCEVCLNTLRLGAYNYVAPWQSEDDQAHFYCRPHYYKMLYNQPTEAKKRREEEEIRSQKRQRKGKSYTIDNIPQGTINALREAADRKKSESKDKPEMNGTVLDVDEEPQVKRKAEVDDPSEKDTSTRATSPKTPEVETPKVTDKKEKQEKASIFRRNRSNSGRFRQLEARPLRRSSISSVRKSDATVRAKGKGYDFDDDLGVEEESGRLSPIRIPSPNSLKEKDGEWGYRPPTPSTTRKSEGRPEFSVEIIEPSVRKKKLEKKNSAEEAIKGSMKPSGDQKESKAKKALDRIHRLGTLERKRRQRRAMYPPLSQVFSPEAENKGFPDGPDKGRDSLPIQASLRKAGINLKVVDIDIGDDTGVTKTDKTDPTRPSRDNKGKKAEPSATAKKSNVITPSSATTRATNAVKSTAKPKQPSPKKQPTPTKQPTPKKEPVSTKQPSPKKQAASKKTSPAEQPGVTKQTSPPNSAASNRPSSRTKPSSSHRPLGPSKSTDPERPERPLLSKRSSTGSLVATRAARIRGLMDNDLRPLNIKSHDSYDDKEKEMLNGEESPTQQRRSLPRVPSSEEPYTSTKESTKIQKRRPTGKPRVNMKEVERDVSELEDNKKEDDEDGICQMAEDMDFVVVDHEDALPYYGIPPPKPPRSLSRDAEPPTELPSAADPEDTFSGSSEEDTLDVSNTSHLQRAGARRYKGKGKTDLPEERLKKQEQAKIRIAMKQRECKRLRMAQQIQRELQEMEVKQTWVERDGVIVEKALRAADVTPAEEQKYMMQWFKIVNRKNALVRYESELVIHANSIQLEDQQGRLEQEIRELLMKEGTTEGDQVTIQLKTKELVDIVEQRNNLVELLDEDRKREQEEDRVFENMLAAKGFITSV